ncbi:hypothetical protein [Micromonospora sp. DT4]|uniref:hypothetical protein n=1 Tax=Micromonospora sp. DT4 TaxID=3393438 RepID=UPI003CECFFA8
MTNELTATTATPLQIARARGRVRGRLILLGPAFVAAVAYVDPGNFATNSAAGARYGYLLVGRGGGQPDGPAGADAHRQRRRRLGRPGTLWQVVGWAGLGRCGRSSSAEPPWDATDASAGRGPAGCGPAGCGPAGRDRRAQVRRPSSRAGIS